MSLVVGTTAIATVAFLGLARWALYPARKSVIRGPLRTTIPYMAEAEVEGLAYRPGMYPGARDVETPVSSLGPGAGVKQNRLRVHVCGFVSDDIS
jgi:hypothetical protein